MFSQNLFDLSINNKDLFYNDEYKQLLILLCTCFVFYYVYNSSLFDCKYIDESESDSDEEIVNDSDDEVSNKCKNNKTSNKTYNFEDSLNIKGIVTFNCLNTPQKSNNNSLDLFLNKYNEKFNALESKLVNSESDIETLKHFEKQCLHTFPDVYQSQINEIKDFVKEIEQEINNLTITKNDFISKLNEAKNTSTKFNNKIAEIKVYENHINNSNKTLTALQSNLKQGLTLVETLNKDINTPSYIQKQNEYVSKTSLEMLNTQKLNALINNYVFDNIPNYGMIIMRYNHKTNTFEYFSNTSLPYNITEAVSKKYMITYNCKQLFIDYSQNLKEQR